MMLWSISHQSIQNHLLTRSFLKSWGPARNMLLYILTCQLGQIMFFSTTVRIKEHTEKASVKTHKNGQQSGMTFRLSAAFRMLLVKFNK